MPTLAFRRGSPVAPHFRPRMVTAANAERAIAREELSPEARRPIPTTTHPMTPSNSSPHRWRFSRAGGLDQVRFETAADYEHLDGLDQKLWVALACPVKGLEIDEKTLAFLDGDKDGRVRAMEVLAAVRWTRAHLKDLTVLSQGSPSLPLDRLRDDHPEAQVVLASARQILENLGKPDAPAIELADVSDTARIFAETRFNGDGVVPVASATDPALQEVIKDIIETLGGEPDRSGKPGVTQAKVDAFFSQLTAHREWAAQAETSASTILPLGESTPSAVAAFHAIRSKVDDYFGRCRLAAFDPRTVALLNRKEEDYLAAVSQDMHIAADEVASFPLARVNAAQPLPLNEGINPAWAEALSALNQLVLTPLLGAGRSVLSETDWIEIKARLAPFETWQKAKPATAVEKLGDARIQAILKANPKPALDALLAEDLALAPQVKAITDVEKLIRYHRDLYRLLNNFVNFSDFYDPSRSATFQAGTLYLDARACRLCVRVDDPAKHAALAGLAKTFLVYCDCSRPGGLKMTLAAAFTDGDADNLMVGRNGIFYDQHGNDWDATITKVIENPISIRQAFWAPYKKLVRMIEEQVAKRAAAAEADADQKVAAAATATVEMDKAKPAAAPAKKIDVGTVAALGVAFGAIGTLVATVLAKMMDLIFLPFWVVVLVLISILLVVSGPSMLIAWLKLRQRNLGPILDASGWAINGRVKVPVSLGRSLTSIAKLPAGTIPALDDKFAEPPMVWPKLIGFLVALGFLYSLLNHYGLIHRLTAGKVGIDPAVAATNEISISAVLGLPTTPETNAPPAAPAEAPAEAAPAPAPTPTP